MLTVTRTTIIMSILLLKYNLGLCQIDDGIVRSSDADADIERTQDAVAVGATSTDRHVAALFASLIRVNGGSLGQRLSS